MDLFLTIVDQFIPMVTAIKNKNCPWIDREVTLALRNKDKLRKIANNTGQMQDVDRFHKARRATKTLLDTKYYDYLTNIKLSLKSNPKKFWSFVKAKPKSSL